MSESFTGHVFCMLFCMRGMPQSGQTTAGCFIA
jgi:hypothetical protein